MRKTITIVFLLNKQPMTSRLFLLISNQPFFLPEMTLTDCWHFQLEAASPKKTGDLSRDVTWYWSEPEEEARYVHITTGRATREGAVDYRELLTAKDWRPAQIKSLSLSQHGGHASEDWRSQTIQEVAGTCLFRNRMGKGGRASTDALRLFTMAPCCS